MEALHVTDIARVVQQVIAPAFMLAGIGTFLSVMAQRLARIIDRAREVSYDSEDPDETADLAALRDQLAIRAKLIQRGIVMCTLAAIVICGLIALMFLDALVQPSLARVIAFVFIGVMGTVMVGLTYFLREVFVATASLRARHIRTGDPKVRNAV
jgi:chloramphenicol 3-O-phosphotransferase